VLGLDLGVRVKGYGQDCTLKITDQRNSAILYLTRAGAKEKQINGLIKTV